MSESWTTLELARLHETQGYYSTAREHYLWLLTNDPGNEELAEAVERMAVRIQEDLGTGDGMDQIRNLAQEWVELMVDLVHIQELQTMRAGVS